MLALSILSLNPRFYKRVGTTYCLLFPHRDRAVERTVEVGVLASTGSHLNKGLVKGAARQADRSAYGKEAGVYFGRIFVPVGVKRHQVAEIADVGG